MLMRFELVSEVFGTCTWYVFAYIVFNDLVFGIRNGEMKSLV